MCCNSGVSTRLRCKPPVGRFPQQPRNRGIADQADGRGGGCALLGASMAGWPNDRDPHLSSRLIVEGRAERYVGSGSKTFLRMRVSPPVGPRTGSFRPAVDVYEGPTRGALHDTIFEQAGSRSRPPRASVARFSPSAPRPVPIIALPFRPLTVADVGEIELMSPGMTIRSVTPATPPKWGPRLGHLESVGRRLCRSVGGETAEQGSVGNDNEACRTNFCTLPNPASAIGACVGGPRKKTAWSRTPDGQNPRFARDSRRQLHRGAPVPVRRHGAVDEDQLEPPIASKDVVEAPPRRAARPTSAARGPGAEPLGWTPIPIWKFYACARL